MTTPSRSGASGGVQLTTRVPSAASRTAKSRGAFGGGGCSSIQLVRKRGPAGAASVPGTISTAWPISGGTSQRATVAPSTRRATVASVSKSGPARTVAPRQSPATVSVASSSTMKPRPMRTRRAAKVTPSTRGARETGCGKGALKSLVASW